MSATDIPTRIREVVHAREQGRCLRCGGVATEMAHRRTRGVHDQHTHCPCNLWYGCHACHQGWQHAQPAAALTQGFAVSRHVAEPGKVWIESWYSRIYLLCNGDIEFTL